MSVQKASFAPLHIRQKFVASSVGQSLRVGAQWLYQRLWLTLFLLAIPALWPFVQEGLPRSFDGGLHLLRLGVLDYLIRHGSLYPRWAPSLMLGYGYPVFNFYAPSTYYLAELLHLLGLSFYASFTATFALLILLAGLGMWLLALDSFGSTQKWAALVAATAYMYAPYLFMNVFISGALAASGAQALLPWIFWSVRRLLRAKRPSAYGLPVAFSLGGLAVTHNLTLLFLPPILLLYIAILWWQTGHAWRTLGWAVFSLVAAMGVSAFFWLPLIVEQPYLADTARIISETALLPHSFWNWRNFLDWQFAYRHNFDRPIRLGIVQLGLGIAGFVLARRRQAEWLFWGAVAMITGAMMGIWALPLWLNNPILAVTQFPWRLLAVTSLPLALFAGGIVCFFQRQSLQMVSTIGLLVVIILAQQPRLQWMDVFAADGTDVTLPVFAQVEVDKGILGGGEGNSSIQEFRPRWVDRTLVLAPATILAPAAVLAPAAEQRAPKFDLRLERGNAYDLTLQATSDAGGPLRFNNFYFPGWQVTLDQQTTLKPYPSTNLGLLTVDLPAGEHTVQLAWAGTPVQTWAGLISLATLGALAWLSWRQQARHWLALLPCGLLIFGVTAFYWPRTFMPIEAPPQTIAANGLRLLGLRTERIDPGHLYLYPDWYVTDPPPKTLRVQWQLLDDQGAVQAETLAAPYFNTTQASNWPPDTLVDDAYTLALPPDLAAGAYQIVVRIGATDVEFQQPAHSVGMFTLTTPVPGQRSLPNPLDVQIGDSMRLTGFAATAANRSLTFVDGKPTRVTSGDYVRYTLYWRANAPVDKNYHGFVHLTDIAGRPLVQEDQLPGPFFRPPLLWDRYYPQADIYLLRIPEDAPSGLYWPEVGMYDFTTRDRLPVRTDGQATPDDHFRLPPLKIVNPITLAPSQPVTAHFGDMADLLGYDLAIPSAGLRAGDHFSVTLYYRSVTAIPTDYTRFLHVANSAAEMAAQFDSPPEQGGNPTWSWTPGETIVDRVDFQVAAQASPGQYTLYLGFYDPKANGARLPVQQADGQAFPDNRAVLTSIQIRAK
ncbi:hypothetical protein BH10CHL1_BH10CHL1_13120 [soil metagenome]